MSFEIDKAFEAFQRSKARQFSEYTQRAHSPILDSVIGYVADVSSLDRFRNAYNVTVPAMANAMLRHVPRKIPDAFAQSNGVGHLPTPLRPGQTVLVKFLNNRTSLPYIDGGFFINGQIDLWEDGKVPQIDEKDLTDLAIFPSPLPPEAQAVKGDAEVKVYPLVLRTSAPTQPSNSAVALEVPGTTYVTDTFGNVYSYFAGERIIVGKNAQQQQAGARQSMADMPKDEAVKRAVRQQAQILEAMASWRSALGGEYTVQSSHPAARRSRSNLGSFGSLGGDGGSLSLSPDGLTGEFQTTIGGTEFLTQAFEQIEGITSLLDQALKVGNGQLDFLQKLLTPLISKLKTLWGSSGGLGLQQLSFQIDLPFNLKLSVSVKFDFKTGKLSIKANLGFGDGTLITGSQPLPIRSEGGIIAGGFQRLENQQIIIRTTITEYTQSSIYQDFPELSGYQPEQLNPTYTPYEHVSRDLSDLNFAVNPSDAVASILTQYGLPGAYQITRYLLHLVRYGSAFDFLKLAALLSNPFDTVIITVGVVELEGFDPIDPVAPNVVLPEVAEVIDSIIKPAIVTCPTLPNEVYQVLFLAQRGETVEVRSIVQNYFQEVLPDFVAWVEDLDNFMSWAEARQHDLYPALYQLHRGSVLNFLLLALYLKTGLDIRRYPRAYSDLQGYVELAYGSTGVGVVLNEVDLI